MGWGPGQARPGDLLQTWAESLVWGCLGVESLKWKRRFGVAAAGVTGEIEADFS